MPNKTVIPPTLSRRLFLQRFGFGLVQARLSGARATKAGWQYFLGSLAPNSRHSRIHSTCLSLFSSTHLDGSNSVSRHLLGLLLGIRGGKESGTVVL
jgi:hypothetical protein